MSDAIQRQFEMLRMIPRVAAVTVQQMHQLQVPESERHTDADRGAIGQI